MAIDKERTKDLVKDIEKLFDDLSKVTSLPPKTVTHIRDAIMGSALTEINKLVTESRPPTLFIVGRTRHGKSSLINCLANKEVAEVGDFKPTTYEATSYTVIFVEFLSTWNIIDTRGFFETTPAKGASKSTATEQIKLDIKKYKPDVIVHVINASEIGGCAQDFKFFEDILKVVKTKDGATPPTFMVLTKADILGNPAEWPPEKNAKTAGTINNLLNYISEDILNVKTSFLNANNPILGLSLTKSNYSAIIPVSTLEERQWNIETLINYIAEKLPTEAKLNFYQALQRKDLLREMSNSIITRFSSLCGAIGMSPIPASDIFILTPIQMLMVAIVGGLSCKPPSLDTAREYFASMGIAGGSAIALRVLAQQVVKLIPGINIPVSGLIAASGTYAIGKSAELYFFTGQIKKPKQIDDKYTPDDVLAPEKSV